MPAGRLSFRWSALAARVAALVTALVAALVVVLLAAACSRAPSAGAPRSPRARLAPMAPHDASHPASRNVITDEQWKGMHVTRIEELIAGRVAGVQVERTLTGMSLRIRGTTTVLGATEPLVVLDGQPLPQGGRELALINPADVARIEVLKDAGATAFYGMRGANGVLLITTRRPR